MAETVALPLGGGLVLLLPQGTKFCLSDDDKAILSLSLTNFTGTVTVAREASAGTRPTGSSPGKAGVTSPVKLEVTSPAKSKVKSPEKLSKPVSIDPVPTTDSEAGADAALLRALQDLFPDVPDGQLSAALRGTSGDLQKAVDRILKRQSKKEVKGGPQGGSAGKARRGSLRGGGGAGSAVAAPSSAAAPAVAEDDGGAAALGPLPDVPGPWPAALARPQELPLAAADAAGDEEALDASWLHSPADSDGVAVPAATAAGSAATPAKPLRRAPSAALPCETSSGEAADRVAAAAVAPRAVAAAAPAALSAAAHSPPSAASPAPAARGAARGAAAAATSSRAARAKAGAAAAPDAGTATAAAAAAAAPDALSSAAAPHSIAGSKRLRSEAAAAGPCAADSPGSLPERLLLPLPAAEGAPSAATAAVPAGRAREWRGCAPLPRSCRLSSPSLFPRPPLAAVLGATLIPIAAAGGAAPSARWAHAAMADSCDEGVSSLLLFGGEDSERVRAASAAGA